MTIEDVRGYVPEAPDKRSQAEWDAMSLEELLAEWDARPVFVAPPYPRDRNRFERLTRVRGEIAVRVDTRPPDGVTQGKGDKPRGAA